MSQALQSLNSLLKYKQERERQKIDRSLSMMDMATRLRQQQLENARQNEMMRMRRADEERTSKLFSKQLQSAELALEKERRESSPEYISLQKRKLEAEARNAELIAETRYNEIKQAELDNLTAAIKSKSVSNKQDIVDDFKRNVGMNALFRATRDYTIDGEFEGKDIQEVKNNISRHAKDKKQAKFLSKIVEQYPGLITGIASYQMLVNKGERSEQSFQPLFESMNRLYDDLNTKKDLVKQFETELNVAVNNLDINNLALMRNQSFDQSFESGALDSQILDIVNKNLKTKGQDKNALRNKLMIQSLSRIGMIPSEQELTSINEQRASEGKPPLTLEDYTDKFGN
tara:strand:- start:6098 stop:7129 length:1032 start_codon:yes stop_codon:yes gene_type:complete